MEKIRILGIAGSPRHANTEIAVKEALAGAAELPDIETELYSMAGKKMNPCSCATKWRCYTEGTTESPCPTWGPNDPIVLLYKKMLTFDGFVIGSPVYMGGVTAQMKALWDRISSMVYGTPPYFALRNKPVGAVAVASYREGGQEETILDIWKYAGILDMMPVGLGADLRDRVCMWGGALTHDYSSEVDLVAVHPRGSPEEMGAAKGDERGLLSCRNTGRRVAEVARVIKAGFKALPREATYWPAGPSGGILEAGWKV